MGLEMVQPRRRLWQSAAGQAVVGPCEELQVARDALVKDRTAALNRQTQVRHRLLKQQHKHRLAQIDRHLAAIDTEIGKRLAEDCLTVRGRRNGRNSGSTACSTLTSNCLMVGVRKRLQSPRFGPVARSSQNS